MRTMPVCVHMCSSNRHAFGYVRSHPSNVHRNSFTMSHSTAGHADQTPIPINADCSFHIAR